MSRWIGALFAVVVAAGVVIMIGRQPAGPAAPGAASSGPATAAVSDLLSEDPEVRQRAIDLWSAPAAAGEGLARPRLFVEEGALDALEVAMAEPSDEILSALSEAFSAQDEWLARFPDLHAHYLAMSLDDPSGARTVGVLDEFERYSRDDAAVYLEEPMSRLVTHPDWKVRLHSIDYAAHYLGVGAEPLLAIGTEDERGEIARAAWIMLAAMRTTGGLDVDFRSMPDRVAEGAILAALMEDTEAGLALLDEADRDEEWSRKLRAVSIDLRRVAEGTLMSRLVFETQQVEPIHRLAKQFVRAEQLLTGDYPHLLGGRN